jgi:hypothetical protein
MQLICEIITGIFKRTYLLLVFKYIKAIATIAPGAVISTFTRFPSITSIEEVFPDEMRIGVVN